MSVTKLHALGLPSARSLLLRDYKQFSQAFFAREQALVLVSQFNQLIKAVQRHRGITMGMLAGNSDFREEFDDLQYQLERRLETLGVFASANDLLSEHDKESLGLAWATIRSNWEEDNLSDNFELHSHFIEQLLHMNAKLTKLLEMPLIMPLEGRLGEGGERGAFSQSRMLQQISILTFVGKELPDMIEQVARIRGAAAYGAAIASLAGFDERRLRFWVNTLRLQSEKLRLRAETLLSEYEGELPGLAKLQQNELALLQFLNTVESVVFSGKGGRNEAHRLFSMATAVIEVYWEVVNNGLDLIREWHHRDLEAWVRLK